jgi:CheY-like chemotaxis protein
MLNPIQGSNRLRTKKTYTGRKTTKRGSLSRLHPQQILVVDDDEIHRQIVCAQLKKLGVSADESASGEEAIAAVMRGGYDMIFMDLLMPGMNGIETSRLIRERFNGSGEMRIVALTGAVTIETRNKCRRAGMNDFIGKPAQIDDLETVLGTRLHDQTRNGIKQEPSPVQLRLVR